MHVRVDQYIFILIDNGGHVVSEMFSFSGLENKYPFPMNHNVKVEKKKNRSKSRRSELLQAGMKMLTKAAIIRLPFPLRILIETDDSEKMLPRK